MPDNAKHKETRVEKENLAGKQKIDRPGRELSDIELDKTSPKQGNTSPWWKKVLFLIPLLASMIPAYLVVQDRWLNNPIGIQVVDDFWRNTPVLMQLGYPRYFLIIFCVMVLTWAVVLVWRNGPMLAFSNLSLGRIDFVSKGVTEKQYRVGNYLLRAALAIASISSGILALTGRIPGWELVLALLAYISGWIIEEYPLERIKRYFQEHGRFLLDISIFVIALCSALYALFGESRPNLIFFVLLVLAGINLVRHRKAIPAIFWISMTSLIALTWRINSWEYAVIGDEYNFYNEVRNILENRTVWELLNLTFNGSLVYGTHPYFSSYIHDFFMKLFDNHNFGWRFSNPFLSAFSLFFFYSFFKTFIPRRTALITVILLGASHYLMSFSKTGYNNLQALFAMGLVLGAFAWAIRAMRLIAFSLLGLSIGFCFYVYPAALYVIPLPVLGLLIYMPPTSREALKRWGWMIVSASLLIYPLMVQPNYWLVKMPGTFFNEDINNPSEALSKNVTTNLLYASLSFLYTPQESHYVSSGYMDPISSIFIAFGAAYLTKLAFSRNRSALFLATGAITMLIIVGATHGRAFPTATRMFLILPYFALFASYGLEWCAEKTSGLFNVGDSGLIVLTAGLIVITNLYNAYVIDIKRMPQYHTWAPLFIKTVREINADPGIPPKSYVFVAQPDWDTSGLEIVQRVYLVPDSPTQLETLHLEGDHLPASAAALVSRRDIIVIVKGDISNDVMMQVDTQLEAWGKSMCEVKNESGNLQFQVWHSGDLGQLCQR